jgi:hypothetical protein
MRWMFFFILFDVSANSFQPRVRVTAVFSSEAECDALGKRIAKEYEYEDNSLRSFSICIPEGAFNDRAMKVHRYDR